MINGKTISTDYSRLRLALPPDKEGVDCAETAASSKGATLFVKDEKLFLYAGDDDKSHQQFGFFFIERCTCSISLWSFFPCVLCINRESTQLAVLRQGRDGVWFMSSCNLLLRLYSWNHGVLPFLLLHHCDLRFARHGFTNSHPSR